MKINPNSKIWIYQANRFFTEFESNKINTLLTNFTQNWQAHGASLSAGYEIRHNLFILLWVDETLAGASGCSIDSSVKAIKQIDEDFKVDLFNRFNMAYIQNEVVMVTDKENFENLVKIDVINQKTIVFNNLVNTYGDLDNNWKTPFAKSWHSIVFTG